MPSSLIWAYSNNCSFFFLKTDPSRIIFGILELFLAMALIASIVLIWNHQYPQIKDALHHSQEHPALLVMIIFLLDSTSFLVFEVWVATKLKTEDECFDYFSVCPERLRSFI